MRWSGLLSLSFVVLGSALMANAEVTQDQALSAVRSTLGADAQLIKTRETGRYYPKYRMLVQLGDLRLTATVDKRTGRFQSYRRATPQWPGRQQGEPAPTVIAPKEAERIAVAGAQRIMGDDYAGLGPRTSSLDEDYNVLGVYWPEQLVGDPPRGGVTPECTVTVSLVDGGIVAVQSRVPEWSQPVTPRVTAEQAVEIARKHLNDPTANLIKDAVLDQNDRGPGSLDWYVTLASAPPAPTRVVKADGTVEEVHISGAGLHLVTVDALTGEVVGDSQAGGTEAIPPGESEEFTPLPSTASVIPSPEPVTKAGGTPALPVVPLVTVGVALLLGVAAVVVVCRRR